MKKRLIGLIFIMLFISGCSFSNFETSNLMHPPKATGEMAQIQALIEKTVGADILFKYPQNGDFKSAIMEIRKTKRLQCISLLLKGLSHI